MAKQKVDNPERVKSFEGQHPDEEVLFVFRRHPVAMRMGLIYMMVALLIGMLPVAVKPEKIEFLWFVAIGFAVGLLIFAYYWVGWYFSVFIVSNMRFIQVSQKGLFNRSVVDIGLDKIQSVNYQIAGLQETLLGFGTILIQTFVGDLMIDQVHKPAEVQERITHIIKELDIVAVTPNPEAQ